MVVKGQFASCLKWINIKTLGDIDMQQLVATEGACTASAAGMSFSDITPIPDQDPRYAQYKVIRRNGAWWRSSRPGFRWP
jgi:hypothetical protein